MSSFMMSNEKLATIAYHVTNYVNNNLDFAISTGLWNMFYLSGCTRSIKRYEIVKLDEDFVYRALYYTNKKALYERYDDPKDMIQDLDDYKAVISKVGKGGITVQVISDIECYLYQCSEGDVYRCIFFNALRLVLNGFCNEVVKNSKMLNECSWG